MVAEAAPAIAIVAAVRAAAEPVDERCLGLACDATDGCSLPRPGRRDRDPTAAARGADRRRIFGGGDRAGADSPAVGIGHLGEDAKPAITRRRHTER
jgi:hypothetical protein